MDYDSRFETVPRRYLDCYICGDLLLEPKILQCLHTYCRKCITKELRVAQNRVLFFCPLCKESISLQDGPARIEDNTIFKKCVHTIYLDILKGDTECMSCRMSTTASHYCTECKEGLCTNCLRCHKNVRLTRGHNVLDVKEYKKSQSVDNERLYDVCLTHSDQEIEIYCLTCEKSICRVCMDFHRSDGHDFMALDEAYIHAKNKIEDLLLKLQEAENRDFEIPAKEPLLQQSGKTRDFVDLVMRQGSSNDVLTLSKLLVDRLEDLTARFCGERTGGYFEENDRRNEQGDKMNDHHETGGFPHKHEKQQGGLATGARHKKPATIPPERNVNLRDVQPQSVSKDHETQRDEKNTPKDGINDATAVDATRQGNENKPQSRTKQQPHNNDGGLTDTKGQGPAKTGDGNSAPVADGRGGYKSSNGPSKEPAVEEGVEPKLGSFLFGFDDVNEDEGQLRYDGDLFDLSDITVYGGNLNGRVGCGRLCQIAVEFPKKWSPKVVERARAGLSVKVQPLDEENVHVSVTHQSQYNTVASFRLLTSGSAVVLVQLSDHHIGDSPYVIVVTKGRDFSQEMEDIESFCFGKTGEGEGEFQQPGGVAVTSEDRIVVCDSNNHRIQIFDEEGKFMWCFGSCGSEPGQFRHPSGVALLPDGRILVSDSWNNRIQMFSQDGEYKHEFGGRGSLMGQLYLPVGLAVDSSGRIIVGEQGNHRVQVFDSEGNHLLSFGKIGSQYGEFRTPGFVAVDLSDNIYVSDQCNGRVQVFDKTGAYLREFQPYDVTSVSTSRPMLSGIAIDVNGNIIVGEKRSCLLHVLSQDGEMIRQFGGKGTGDKEWHFPVGVALFSDCRLIVTDWYNNRVHVF